MVDIINEVYTRLKKLLPKATVSLGRYEGKPSFPCVEINYIDDTNDIYNRDSGGDKYSIQTIEVNIYTTGKNKRPTSNNIRDTVNNLLAKEYNMNRGYGAETPNYADMNVFRYTLRYSYKIDENKTIYRS